MFGSAFRRVLLTFASLSAIWLLHGAVGVATPPHDTALFWGIAHTNVIGSGAFVLCLSDEAGKSTILIPPEMRTISSLERAAKNLRLESSPVFGRVQRFSGVLDGGSLEGTLALVTREPREPDLLYTVSARQLRLQKASGPASSLTLSDAGPIAETGDFVGTHLEIASTSQGYRGFIVFYDGYWGEQPNFAYYLFDIARTEKTVTFQTMLASGRVGYHVELAGTTGRLFRDDQKHDVKGVLLRSTKPLVSCPLTPTVR